LKSYKVNVDTKSYDVDSEVDSEVNSEDDQVKDSKSNEVDVDTKSCEMNQDTEMNVKNQDTEMNVKNQNMKSSASNHESFHECEMDDTLLSTQAQAADDQDIMDPFPNEDLSMPPVNQEENEMMNQFLQFPAEDPSQNSKDLFLDTSLQSECKDSKDLFVDTSLQSECKDARFRLGSESQPQIEP